ncbi:glycerophosphodiester phosphodiesterase [Jiangella alkaliphila]|uniref:Glycerophosphoryl diester phosphodiesterase n=1 Tax=Jiangella alkaliphila TaxID=419479 RepID=A0A1H2M5N3_9ACTN|nr:glycerophosphodiester phosphodiesterase [Jiangella alkaliphila]SDU88577.1 glycerophosphoryl diester phosphodiesterase [Jiangella alkaliphila]
MSVPRIPPITFAHRGAMARERENTLSAFELALRLGASGLESDAWVSADGVVVLDHDGVVGPRFRRRPIAELPRSELPAHVPSLAELYAACGTDFELSLDVKDPAAFAPVVAAVRAGGAPERTWLCHPSLSVVTAWRAQASDVRLVDSTRVSRLQDGVRGRARTLAARGVDAVNLHRLDWTPIYVDLFHEVGVHAFGWDAQSRSAIDQLLATGVDAVYGNHVDRLVAAVARFS